MNGRAPFDPMAVRPPPCACGEAQAARAELRENPANPMCHICRVIAVEHPDWHPRQIAAAGARRWKLITPESG